MKGITYVQSPIAGKLESSLVFASKTRRCVNREMDAGRDDKWFSRTAKRRSCAKLPMSFGNRISLK